MLNSRKKQANQKIPLAKRWQNFKYLVPGYKDYDKWLDKMALKKRGDKEVALTSSSFLAGMAGGMAVGPITHEGAHILAAKVIGKTVYYVAPKIVHGMPVVQVGIAKGSPLQDAAIGMAGPVSDIAVGLALIGAAKRIKNPYARGFCRGAGVLRLVSPAHGAILSELTSTTGDLQRVAIATKMALLQRCPELSSEISKVPNALLVTGIATSLYLAAYGTYKYGPAAAQKFKEGRKVKKELRFLRGQGMRFGTAFNRVPLSNKRAKELLEKIKKAQGTG